MVDGGVCGGAGEGRIPERHGFGLRAGDRGDEDVPGARTGKGKGAGAGGGAGGVDVVDEQDIAAGDEGGLRDGEGATQVLATLTGVEAELAFGLAGAGEEMVGRLEAQRGMRSAEGAEGVGGEELGLVEAAIARLAAEERDGGDEGFGQGIEGGSEIGDGVGEEAAEWLCGGPEPIELEQAEEIAELARVDTEGDGAGEGGRDAATRGAAGAGGVAAGDEALALKAQSFSADGAEGGCGVGFSLRAKGGEAGFADGKGGGVEEGSGAEAAVAGKEGGEEIVEEGAGCAEEDRVVLRRALGRALCV